MERHIPEDKIRDQLIAHQCGLRTVAGYLVLFGIVKLLWSDYECYLSLIQTALFSGVLILMYYLGRNLTMAVRRKEKQYIMYTAVLLSMLIALVMFGEELLGGRFPFWMP